MNALSNTRSTENSEKSHFSIRHYFWAITLALFMAGLLRQFVFQSYRIHSGSMKPSLLVGDYMLINRAAYGLRSPFSRELLWQFSQPERGDVIVFTRFSEEDVSVVHPHYVKRVVGVPGDTVEVRDYVTYVNGREVPFGENGNWRDMVLRDPETRSYPPRRLGDDEYFVLGDNRSNSRDSRYYGPVLMRHIEGKTLLLYWSSFAEDSKLSEDRSLRWWRIGRIIN
jgi:signal peptidase I